MSSTQECREGSGVAALGGASPGNPCGCAGAEPLADARAWNPLRVCRCADVDQGLAAALVGRSQVRARAGGLGRGQGSGDGFEDFAAFGVQA